MKPRRKAPFRLRNLGVEELRSLSYWLVLPADAARNALTAKVMPWVTMTEAVGKYPDRYVSLQYRTAARSRLPYRTQQTDLGNLQRGRLIDEVCAYSLWTSVLRVPATFDEGLPVAMSSTNRTTSRTAQRLHNDTTTLRMRNL
jgi:hypothetical protein